MKEKFKEIAKKISIKKSLKNILGKITGKCSNSLKKESFLKFKNGCKNVVSSLLPTDLEKQSEIQSQIAQIDSKSEGLTELVDKLRQDKQYTIGTKNCYLKQVESELLQLKDKRMEVSSGGLSVFALSKLTLLRIAKNIRTRWNSFVEDAKETKQQFKNQKGEKLLSQNLSRQQEIQESTLKILEKYPELESYYNDLYKNMSNAQEDDEHKAKTR